MLKGIVKYIYLVILSIVFIGIIFGCLFFERKLACDFSTDTISLKIASEFPSGEQEIKMHRLEQNGSLCFFLPSYAKLNELKFSISTESKVVLGKTLITDGMGCEIIDLETSYSLTVDDHYIADLQFYQSENVATMYIDTATGTMKRIHADIDYSENASVMLYTVDGTVDHCSDNSVIKGRGNSTWSSDKKPYLLNLNSEEDLLGMGLARKWVLLANSSDATHLNNYLAFDLASRVGFSWVPDCYWVDLYLNGEYNGLYLLTERVEVGQSRLNIDAMSGDFLCRIDLFNRWDKLSNPALTEGGRTVAIEYPERVDSADAERILYYVNEMERDILAGQDLNTDTIIDLDSWVRRYLIDEIFGNEDSDSASSYFFCSDGIIYAGPIWDYDLSLRSSTIAWKPNSFKAIKKAINNESVENPYYYALYQNESFYNRMVQIYQSDFLPILQEMVDTGIDDLTILLSDATQMNNVRWNIVTTQTTQPQKPNVKVVLEQRLKCLNSLWLPEPNSCIVLFELSTGEECWASVQKGNSLETSDIDLSEFSSLEWVISETNEEFDFSQPIVSDLILTQRRAEVPADEPGFSLATRDYITLLSIAILLIMLVVFVIIDVVFRCKERKYADAGKRKKVPS